MISFANLLYVLLTYLIEIHVFFTNHTESNTGKLVSDLFLFFKKTLYKVSSSGLQLSFNIFDNPKLDIQSKQTFLDYLSRDMLNFDLEKGLKIVSPPHFVYNFS